MEEQDAIEDVAKELSALTRYLARVERALLRLVALLEKRGET
jgi:hypothetical protein